MELHIPDASQKKNKKTSSKPREQAQSSSMGLGFRFGRMEVEENDLIQEFMCLNIG